MPKVSVCIPTYNRAKFLQESIESVLAQTYRDFELIICNNASTDNTIDIVKSFKDPRIKFFINDKNIEGVNNVNKCIELAKGDYITIFHDDDVMILNNLEHKVKFLDENPNVGLVYSDVYMIDANGKAIDGPFTINMNSKQETVLGGLVCFKKLIFEWNFICCPSVLLRKRCYDKLGKYDVRLPGASDYEMWARISLYHDVGYISKPLIKYRWHEGNDSHNFQGKKILKGMEQDFLARIIALENYHKSPNKNKIKRRELNNLYCEIIWFYFSANNNKLTKRIFFYAVKRGLFTYKMFLYYIATFLPFSCIKDMKLFKCLMRLSRLYFTINERKNSSASVN